MIRPLTESDIPRLTELYTELSGEPTDPVATAQAFKNIHNNPAYHLMGIWNMSTLAGSAMGVVCTQLCRDSRPFMIMENFIIASRFRRQGLGRKLLTAMENIAKAHCCRCILFLSSNKRKEAHEFYRAAGYDPDAVKGFKKLL